MRIIRKSIQGVANRLGYRIVKDADVVMHTQADHIIKRYRPYTRQSEERIYALYQSVQYLIKAGIPGAFVECGVLKGGSAMIMAHALKELHVDDRDIYLYDTFAGMSEPTNHDRRIQDRSDSRRTWKSHQKRGHNEWSYASREVVEENMRLTGYPLERFIFVEGKVEETVPRHAPKRIALLRLDTDWYESTRHELIHFFPLLSKGGVLIIDDYGTYSGCKKAVDEYFAKKPALLQRIDHTGRLIIKT